MRSLCAVLLIAALTSCAADATVAQVPVVAPPDIALSADGGQATGGMVIADDVMQRCLSGDGDALACKRGEPHACGTLAEQMTDDAWCRGRLRKLACNSGDAQACVRLAATLPDEQRARLLDKTCDGGYGPACTARGEQFENQPDAIKMFELGCDKGDARGCKRAAQEYESGPERDRTKRVIQLGKGCELGDADMCIEQARALMFGVGVARDPVRGQQLLQRVCAGDGSDEGAACHLLVQVLESTRSTTVSGVEIAKLSLRACNQGQFDACTRVATEHYTNGRYEEAIAVSDTMIAKNPTHWLPRYTRGMSRFDLGEYAAAAADLAKLTEARAEWHYAHLWHFVAVARSGGNAKAALEQASQKLDKDAWPMPVVHFFVGKLSAAQLMRKANHHEAHKQLEQQCEVFFYTAQQELIRGRTKAAKRLLEKTINTGLTNFVEYASAKAELARLEASAP